MIAFEVLLPIGAIGFYLVDSALLLFGNELALEHRAKRWRCSPGSAFQFGGRRIYVPNPLTPGASLFRVSWHASEPVGMSGSLDLAALRRLTRPFRYIAAAQAFLLLAALAPISILLGSGAVLLLLFALFYVLTLATVALLVARRRALGVSNRECLVLAFEIFACAPFAVNIVRRLTLRASRELPWLRLAQQEFGAAERERLEGAIREQVELLLLDQEPGSEKELRLARFQAELKDRLHGTLAA